MSQSPFQRFIRELRRRHVPQTAAIYLVAAWAAIEFADVVVPNLNGPQWVVTAVIVAALAGLPVMLVMAWIFEWGPEGLSRTEDVAEGMEAPPSYDAESGEVRPSPAAEARRAPPDRSRPWMAVLAILVVGIGSALAAAYVLQGGDGDAEGGAGQDTVEAVAPAGDRAREGSDSAAEGAPPLPMTPEGILSPGFADSLQERIRRQLGGLDTMDVSGFMRIAAESMARMGVSVMLTEPEPWRGGPEAVEAAPLAEGDTLRIRGVAYDTAGVVEVRVDGRPAVAFETGPERARFTTSLTGTESAGIRTVVIEVRTADGRTVRREYPIAQLPGGIP